MVAVPLDRLGEPGVEVLPERGLKQHLRAEDIGAHELRRAQSAMLPVSFQ
ncbi:hypothetical protein ACFVYE_17830 [Streptomyces sp. NPDC058239]